MASKIEIGSDRCITFYHPYLSLSDVAEAFSNWKSVSDALFLINSTCSERDSISNAFLSSSDYRNEEERREERRREEKKKEKRREERRGEEKKKEKRGEERRGEEKREGKREKR